MVRDDLPLSKDRINRAGRALCRDLVGESPSLPDDELVSEMGVVEAFRAAHRIPLLKARMGLQSCVRAERLEAVEFGQRLKRMPTIIDKLRRLPWMKLSIMQDIGGCRAVFSTQAEVARVQERFMRNSLRRNGTDDAVSDYITKPRSSGYRGVHVLTRYDGRRIEVQLRTQLQHEWAKLVEKLVVATGTDYKSGDGSDIVHRWLRKLSEACALAEAGQPSGEEFDAEYDALEEAAMAQIRRDIE